MASRVYGHVVPSSGSLAYSDGSLRTARLSTMLRKGPQGGTIGVNINSREIAALADRLADAVHQHPAAVSRALNRTAPETRTAMGRALVGQTGLKYGSIRRALTVVRSSPAFLATMIVAKGGYLPLRLFRARQGKRGVSAAPWGKRRVFPHTFIIPAYGGNVYVRQTSARFPIEKLFGPAIPVEFTKDQSADAFYRTVPGVLLKRLDHELSRLMPA